MSVFLKHFETGGTFLDFDVERLKNFYKEKFEKGKEVAEQMRKEYTDNKGESSSDFDPIDQIAKLNKLKNEGAITAEEFETLKKKVIEKEK